MPRPISWLPRLAEIRRSVHDSVRSHYDRNDIQRLFQIQPRSAQVLIQSISPSAKIGRSFLLERAALASFLDRIVEGADPASLLAQRSVPTPRRRLRELVQVDRIPATLETAPGNIEFQPGRLTISFETMEQLAGALMALAQILDDAEQFAAFEERFVPRSVLPTESDIEERADIERMFADLERLECEHGITRG